VKGLNKKFLLVKLVEQLDDEKVDTLIDVVKGMVYPTAANDAVALEEVSHHYEDVTEFKKGETIVTQNINEIFR